MRQYYPIFLTFLLCLLPWFMQEQVKSMNADIAWLVEGASRLLEGRTMSGAIYDTNPPLSILINIPTLLVRNVTGLSLEAVVLVMTLLCAGLSAMASFTILRRWFHVDRFDALIFVSIFGVACTVFSYPDLGQRDQLIGFGLLPFVLLQLAITCGYVDRKKDWFIWVIFFAGAFVLMLKPNYGLFPSLMLLHRVWVKKNITVLRDPDFVALAVITSLYATGVWFFFHDYIAVIVEDVVTLYAILTQFGFLIKGGLWIVLFLAGLIAVFYGSRNMPERQRQVLRLLVIAALVNMIPYLVMRRGFSYHVLPSLLLFTCGFGFFYYQLMLQTMRPVVAGVFVLILLSGLGYGIHLQPQVAKRATLKDLPVTQLVRECGPDCQFWMINRSLPITQLTAFYGQRDHASRFPSFWFLNGLQKLKTQDPDQYQYFGQKYAGMVVSDLREYQPNLIIDCIPHHHLDFLFQNPAFLSEWGHYQKDGVVQVNEADYYFKSLGPTGGVLTCDVLKRSLPRAT